MSAEGVGEILFAFETAFARHLLDHQSGIPQKFRGEAHPFLQDHAVDGRPEIFSEQPVGRGKGHADKIRNVAAGNVVREVDLYEVQSPRDLVGKPSAERSLSLRRQGKEFHASARQLRQVLLIPPRHDPLDLRHDFAESRGIGRRDDRRTVEAQPRRQGMEKRPLENDDEPAVGTALEIAHGKSRAAGFDQQISRSHDPCFAVPAHPEGSRNEVLDAVIRKIDMPELFSVRSFHFLADDGKERRRELQKIVLEKGLVVPSYFRRPVVNVVGEFFHLSERFIPERGE